MKDGSIDLNFFLRISHKPPIVHSQHHKGLLDRFVTDKMVKIVPVTCLLHENYGLFGTLKGLALKYFGLLT